MEFLTNLLCNTLLFVSFLQHPDMLWQLCTLFVFLVSKRGLVIGVSLLESVLCQSNAWTDICLVDKHFKKPSKLSKIFNRNTLKVSYSSMPNVASIITSHNKKILGNTTPDAICNCGVKSQCSMDGKCQERSIIYKAVVTSAETKKQYIGLTEHAFNFSSSLQNNVHCCESSWDCYVFNHITITVFCLYILLLFLIRTSITW